MYRCAVIALTFKRHCRDYSTLSFSIQLHQGDSDDDEIQDDVEDQVRRPESPVSSEAEAYAELLASENDEDEAASDDFSREELSVCCRIFGAAAKPGASCPPAATSEKHQRAFRLSAERVARLHRIVEEHMERRNIPAALPRIELREPEQGSEENDDMWGFGEYCCADCGAQRRREEIEREVLKLREEGKDE